MLKSLVYQIDGAPFALANEAERIYEKQVIYAGDFEKHLPGKKRPHRFSIEHAKIDHWAKTVKQMIADGIKIPMPLGHSMNPEHRRGEVVGARVGVDDKKRYSLFLQCKFQDEEAEKQHKHNNVSIFVVDDYTNSATKKKYIEPIMHLGLTDYPVIPDLGPFQALALSLALEDEQGDDNMALPEIAKALELPEDADEKAIVDKIKELQDKIAELEDGKDTKEEPPADKKDEPVVAASFVTREIKSRERDIAELQTKGIVTKATADKLRKKWLNPATVKLALSLESGDDGFEDVIEAFKANGPVVPMGKSGFQLSNGDNVGVLPKAADPKTNRLLANAQERSKQAKQ